MFGHYQGGYPPAMTTDGLRFRVYVDGRLADERWLDLDSDFHAAIAAQNEVIGRSERWLIEVYNPDAPEDQAYVRFGGDRQGMVEPHDVPDGDIARALGIDLRA